MFTKDGRIKFIDLKGFLSSDDEPNFRFGNEYVCDKCEKFKEEDGIETLEILPIDEKWDILFANDICGAIYIYNDNSINNNIDYYKLITYTTKDIIDILKYLK